MKKDEGLRYNTGKIRTDLFPPDILMNVSKILTQGADKYEPRNWEKGMSWSSVLASLKRHLSKFERGDDIDEESKLHHIDHVLCNAAFLSRYVRSHPEFDDRYVPFIQDHKNIALDIDGVLADFIGPALKKAGVKNKGNSSWYPSYKMRDKGFWGRLIEDREFWVNLPVITPADSLRFEPIAYVTARSIPVEWTEEWLEKNGFPCNPVYVVKAEGGDHSSKADQLKSLGADIFIDDSYRHFLDLNQQGLKTYLMDSYYNKRWGVGSRRIKHPNDVLKHFYHE